MGAIALRREEVRLTKSQCSRAGIVFGRLEKKLNQSMEEKGTISIHTENIFPIIKKFLYSDHEIFLREFVSNAVDATQKVKRLVSLGEYQGELGDLTIDVSVDKEAKTITITDRGIGMTAEEIKKYINQIAFSGASEFLEKYKDKGEESANHWILWSRILFSLHGGQEGPNSHPFLSGRSRSCPVGVRRKHGV